LNPTGRHESKSTGRLALALALAFSLGVAGRAQNIKLATPTPTPTQRQAPPPQPKGGGGNPINIPYVPPPPGPSKLPPAGGALCMIIPGCKPPAPQLSSAFPFSNLTPGGYVIVYGKNFSSLNGPGKLQFELGGTVHDLVDLQWSDTAVGGRVPDGWNWTSADEVDMWVLRADGVKSNTLNPRPKFSPIWDVQQINLSAMSDWHCAPSDDYLCTDRWGATSQGNHGTTYGHDSGTDYYKGRFINGWKTESYTFAVVDSHDGTVQEPSGFRENYDWFDVQVHWDQDGGNIIAPHFAKTSYVLNIFIRGPKGYAWK
jgi:hypothetical protein